MKNIRSVAIIGSGIMGASVAALLASAGCKVCLLDIVPEDQGADSGKRDGPSNPAFRNSLALKAIKNIADKKSRLLLDSSALANIVPGNMEDDLDKLGEADWIIEVVVERLAVKKAVIKTIGQHMKKEAIVSSNTSGVPIHSIIEDESQAYKEHFLGTHFFNPVRYMHLLEIIPTEDTNPQIIEDLTAFARRFLGKGVVLAKDTPNFIGNRIGAFVSLDVMRLAQQYGFNYATGDLITGPFLGRPKSGTYRTCDMVGLDTLAHVADNVLCVSTDAFEQANYRLLPFVEEMLAHHQLGDKTGGGFYKVERSAEGRKIITSWNPEKKQYEAQVPEEFAELKAVACSENKVRAMLFGEGKVNRFAWEHMKHVFRYCAERVPEISDDFRAIDQAMRWGYNWEAGPFELWDLAGFQAVCQRMLQEDEPLPDWIMDRYKRGDKSLYEDQTETSDGRAATTGGSPAQKSDHGGQVIAKNAFASISVLDDSFLLLAFHSRGNALHAETFNLLNEVLDMLEQDQWLGLVISHEGKNFSAGADLTGILQAAQQGDSDMISRYVEAFQGANLKIKYARKPIVTAPFAMTLGGGAEIVLHSRYVVPYVETYVGLVEAGVGLIPGGGGCKELLFKSTQALPVQNKATLLALVEKVWTQIAMANVSGSAYEAIKDGFIPGGSYVSMERQELIPKALRLAKTMAAIGQSPCYPRPIPVTGKSGYAHLDYIVETMLEGRKISPYDAVIARKLAYVLTGGDVLYGTQVSEKYILELEKQTFVELCQQKKTQERMAYMLQKGKALRN